MIQACSHTLAFICAVVLLSSPSCSCSIPGCSFVTGTVGRHDHAVLPDCWEAHMAADEDQAVSADEEVVA
jgi:hypothetical protein